MDGVGRVGRVVRGWDGVGQFTISPREVRKACFGLELKADQIYRCDIIITHRRDGHPSGALLSHSLLFTRLTYSRSKFSIPISMINPNSFKDKTPSIDAT